jgi:hypothetical protein
MCLQVAFPLQLDAYEFATPELKAQLDGPRSTEAAAEDERDAAAKRQKREAVSSLRVQVYNSATVQHADT